MKFLLKSFQAWKSKNKFTMFAGSILSLIIIALPFIAGIFAAVTFIEDETSYMVVALLCFLTFAGAYIGFTKYMNKL